MIKKEENRRIISISIAICLEMINYAIICTISIICPRILAKIKKVGLHTCCPLCFTIFFTLMWCFYMTEYRNRPNFSRELGKIICIFADFGINRNIVGYRNFVFWRMAYSKIPRTLKLLRQKCNAASRSQ